MPPKVRCRRPATSCRRRSQQGLPAVVVINKVDRPDARIEEVADEIYQLFFDLDAADHHIEFPIISSIARHGHAMVGTGIPGDDTDLAPLLDAIVENIPAAVGRSGRPAPGARHQPRRLRRTSAASRSDGSSRARSVPASRWRCATPTKRSRRCKRRLTQLMGFEHLGRVEVDDRVAGDLFVVAGFPEVEIGDTIADADDPQPLPRLEVDEPVLRMTFGVNTSPLSGKDGRFVTSRQIKERLDREVLGNVSIRIGATSSPEIIEVAGRGELQLAVLIESMRREGYELQVSRPEVIIREIDGRPHEPLERAVVDVPNEHVGTVTQAVAPRKGQVTDLRPGDAGRTIVTLTAPARGLLGFRSLLMTATRGTALVHQHHAGWMPWAGELPHRQGGAMTADRLGTSTGFALDNLQKRGELFIGPNTDVYEGMIIGEASRPEDMQVNPDQDQAAHQHQNPLHRRGDQARSRRRR